MADIIQLRRDTAANWTSANPILAQGELGVETDTNKAKLGDGSTAWTSLDYWEVSNVAGLVNNSDATWVTVTSGEVAQFNNVIQQASNDVLDTGESGDTVQG